MKHAIICWRFEEPVRGTFTMGISVKEEECIIVEQITNWLQQYGDDGCCLAYPQLNGWYDCPQHNTDIITNDLKDTITEIVIQSRYNEDTPGSHYDNGKGRRCQLIDDIVEEN